MIERSTIETQLTMPQGAIFSQDFKFRYMLSRVWSLNKPKLLFIGLNPSKADSRIDDPTVTRCMARAAREGFGSLLVGNLFAFISTDPADLVRSGSTVGEENDDYLRQMISMSDRVLCGWGAFPEAGSRAPSVLKMVKEPYCLGMTADGAPKHPLYISYKTKMQPMRCEAKQLKAELDDKSCR